MKSTKKSLIASGVALLASVALLAGTTFAWFTDSVTNTGNKIQAGTLDITATVAEVAPDVTAFIIKNATTGETVNGGKPFGFGEPRDIEKVPGAIISEENWEPGQSSAKLLTVTNNGTLAAKVKLDFSVIESELAGALWYDFIRVTDGAAQGTFTKRPMSTLEEMEALEFPLESGENLRFILVYGMDEEAGNAFQGKSFAADVTILAKQAPKETDGFDNPDYDAEADYPVWDGTSADTTWYDAQDTAYTLSAPAQLAGLAQLVNEGTTFENVTITLTENLYLGNQEWTPIGQKGAGKFFQGTFDGNGKTVSGLKISAENNNDADTFDGYAALFGATQNAVVQNVTVYGTVDAQNAAGIVARANEGTTIRGCVSNVTVTGSTKAGGIVCLANAGGVTIADCVNNGAVTGGNDGLGGIAGYVNTGTAITGCTNTGAVGGEASRFAGGIVGYGSAGNSTVSSCENTGAVTAGTNAGGIVGIATDAWTVTDCVNGGNVNGGNTADAGGILGSMQGGTVESCRNTAAVHGRYAGGVVGSTGGAAEVVHCAGGRAAITSPAFTLGFTGQTFTLDLDANACAGRLIGANAGGGPDVWTRLTIDDDSGDDYTGIGDVGICGPYTTWANLEIVAGTLHGDPVAGNLTFIRIDDGVEWNGREAGTYSCGGLNEAIRKDEWTK